MNDIPGNAPGAEPVTGNTQAADHTIALTGATGFVGRHALARLLADGWQVRTLARSPERMQRVLTDLPQEARARVEVFHGDLSDGDTLRRLLEGVDAVLHVAGLVKAPNERAFLHANAEAAARLARLAREKVNELYHHDWVARSPKVQEHLDWTPALQFAEGLLDTLCYWCDHGRLPRSRLPLHHRDHPREG